MEQSQGISRRNKTTWPIRIQGGGGRAHSRCLCQPTTFIPSAGTWKPKAENVISRIGTKQERDSNVVLPHTTVSVGGMSILTSAQARPLGNENLALGR